jgi:MFS transporter, YNFM family, putative membrane transport protein
MAVVFAGFTAFLTLYATQPLLPLLTTVFGASKVAVSLTVTAATAGVAIAAPLIGTVADRLGRKRVIVWSAGLVALTTFGAATAPSLSALILWRFLEGIATPGIFAITVAYIQEEWSGKGTAHATAAYVAGTVLGGFTGRFTSGIVAARFGWQMSFIALGALAVIATAVLARYLPRERRFTARVEGVSVWAAAADHLRNRHLLATYAAGFCVLFSLIGTFTYVTFYLAAPPFRMSTAALGTLFFVYLIGAVITPWCGRAVDRFGHRRAMTMAVVIAMSGVLLTSIPVLLVVIAGLALCCTGVFIAQSIASMHIGIAAEHNRALAVGLYVAFYYGGGSLGAALPGYAWDFGGWPACVALFLCVQLVTISVTMRWWSDSR